MPRMVCQGLRDSAPNHIDNFTKYSKSDHNGYVWQPNVVMH